MNSAQRHISLCRRYGKWYTTSIRQFVPPFIGDNQYTGYEIVYYFIPCILVDSFWENILKLNTCTLQFIIYHKDFILNFYSLRIIKLCLKDIYIYPN